MEDRLLRLEEKVGEIHSDQAAIKGNISSMDNTLSVLADIRAETLHLMKQQDQDKKDHDEIFERLRVTEAQRATCDEKHKTVGCSINKLEKNQRWGVVAILAGIIGYAFKKLIL